MITKIQAAKRCVSSGIACIIANGKNPNIVEQIFAGTFRGTLFLPSENTLSLRKKWIGFVSSANGSVLVDDGAKLALLKKNKSLLPSGIVEIHGEFKANETISIIDLNNEVIAKGVTRFSSTDLEKIKGKKTSEVEIILHRKTQDEVIHRDNLVLFGETS